VYFTEFQTAITCLLVREGLLWVKPIDVAQKAILEIFLIFPGILLEKVLKELHKIYVHYKDFMNIVLKIQ
jgi:hypothetical protein